MKKITDIDEFMNLYKSVKQNFSLPDYTDKFKEPYSDIVLANYYSLINLLQRYNILNYLYDTNFRYLFIKFVFEGNFDSIENNFEYLMELKNNFGINIIDDVKLLFNLFSYNSFFFKSGTLESVELAHSLIVDANPSENVYEKFGRENDFHSIINAIAHDKSVPPFFNHLFPGLSYYGYNLGSKDNIEAVVINRAASLAADISICELCNIPLANYGFSFYSHKVLEDIEFFKNRYVVGNPSGIIWSNLVLRLKELDCYSTIIGSFSDIYDKLESISKNLGFHSTNIFDYFMKEENLPLFDKIVTNLDSYVDYSDYITYKSAEFNAFSFGIVTELCSKLHFYYYLNVYSNSSTRLFNDDLKVIDVLKSVAQIKKQEILGDKTYDNAMTEVNSLFSAYSRNGNGQLIFDQTKCKLNYDDIDDVNIGFYLLLCNDYFESSSEFKGNFKNIYDFIIQGLKRKQNNKLPDYFMKLVRINPLLLNYFELQLDDVDESIVNTLDRFEKIEGLSFYSKLDPCMAFDLENFDLDSLTMSSNELNLLFDTMAVRYHTRIGFDDFYKNNLSSISNIDGIYSMKNLYKTGFFNWERDRIHTLIYFAYLENNMAHDISDSAIFSYLRSVDYFSNIFSNDFKSTFSSLKNIMDKFIVGIKSNCFQLGNKLNNVGLSLILEEVKKILSDVSISDKKNALIMYLGQLNYGSFNSTFIDEFLCSFNNSSDFYLTYFDLAIENVKDFENKSKCVESVILQFYEDLKTMRLESGNLSDSFIVEAYEAKTFYEKYGYLIDIRFDRGPRTNCAVLYMMDKHLEFTHGVHMFDVPNMVIPSMGNSVLEFYEVVGDVRVDKNVDDNFKFHIKSAANCRQTMSVAKNYSPSDIFLSKLNDKFEGSKLFFSEKDMSFFIVDSVEYFDSVPSRALYHYLCKCLRDWNEQKLLSVQPSVHKLFGV